MNFVIPLKHPLVRRKAARACLYAKRKASRINYRRTCKKVVETPLFTLSLEGIEKKLLPTGFPRAAKSARTLRCIHFVQHQKIKTAPNGIRTRVLSSKRRNDWPDYTMGALYSRNILVLHLFFKLFPRRFYFHISIFPIINLLLEEFILFHLLFKPVSKPLPQKHPIAQSNKQA